MRLSRLLLSLVVVAVARADVSCPPIFGDHMVLQRDRPLPVWGKAEAGETVTVEFAGQKKSATAGADGAWRVALDPLPASAESRSLAISGHNTMNFSDVLVGEVWFCSGQSNMEKPLGLRKGQKPTDNYEAELARADCPPLRLFQGLRSGKPRAHDVTLRWLPCTGDALTGMEFSAAAYYFGRELQRALGVPVGLIHSSFGGTRIEAWMPHEAFAGDPQLAPLEKVIYDHYVDGVQATELFQTRVAPFVPFALRGFLWYQGEANVMNAEGDIYATKLRALIRTWRAAWGEPTAPFYFAQLAPFAYSAQKNWTKQLTPDALPALWAAQVAALDVPRTGLIATSDVAGNGRDIHPPNKRDVGLRFANLALADTYGRKELLAHPPRFAALHRPWFGNKVEIEFTDAPGLRSRDGRPLTDFQIAGRDRKFQPAAAVLKGDRVIVSNGAVARPVAVRFAWHELAIPNLVNAAGLPALPFRTDDWPLELEVAK